MKMLMNQDDDLPYRSLIIYHSVYQSDCYRFDPTRSCSRYGRRCHLLSLTTRFSAGRIDSGMKSNGSGVLTEHVCSRTDWRGLLFKPKYQVGLILCCRERRSHYFFLPGADTEWEGCLRVRTPFLVQTFFETLMHSTNSADPASPREVPTHFPAGACMYSYTSAIPGHDVPVNIVEVSSRGIHHQYS